MTETPVEAALATERSRMQLERDLLDLQMRQAELPEEEFLEREIRLVGQWERLLELSKT